MSWNTVVLVVENTVPPTLIEMISSHILVFVDFRFARNSYGCLVSAKFAVLELEVVLVT